MEIKSVPIRRVGNRDNLFLECDRELVMMAGLLSVALIFSAQDLKATIFGVLLWFFSVYVLRLMAKSDPKMRFVYLRHRKYQAYYAPYSSPFRENTTLQGNRYL
ncbi:conjugal transfer protein TrbD [Zophobihabitans entericus]|uniref:Conjugal transfer protein TrbD n=1 Tax=Zophobihabitans entericus TaxID=1635327 RepID=A0A6G9IE53_9GAMM|nr:conjugal transfer protein TrbD [Zophobihabitans entericus]QIQ22521.1 conjugal transfer protein TrbD [Zophobihabitans entericus]